MGDNFDNRAQGWQIMADKKYVVARMKCGLIIMGLECGDKIESALNILQTPRGTVMGDIMAGFTVGVRTRDIPKSDVIESLICKPAEDMITGYTKTVEQIKAVNSKLTLPDKGKLYNGKGQVIN